MCPEKHGPPGAKCGIVIRAKLISFPYADGSLLCRAEYVSPSHRNLSKASLALFEHALFFPDRFRVLTPSAQALPGCGVPGVATVWKIETSSPLNRLTLHFVGIGEQSSCSHDAFMHSDLGGGDSIAL